MSGHEVPPPDDHLLAEFLAGEGAVRTVYRERAQECAPAALDAAILQAAQAATARPLPRVARRRWQAPLAAAAVLVLSFGVLLQVQHDPVAQSQVFAPPVAVEAEAVAPSPAVAQGKVVMADRVAEPAPSRRDAPASAASKPRRAEPAKLLPPVEAALSQPMEKAQTEVDSFAAPAAAPPPPAVAMMAEREQKAAAMAMAEASKRDERAAFAPAPMSKLSRALPAAGVLASAAAPAADEAAWLESWAQRCIAPASHPAISEWRGLAVTSWTQAVQSESFKTALVFAPTLSHQAIVTALGPLADRQALAHPQCAQPVMRELRETGGAWALVCECEAAAH